MAKRTVTLLPKTSLEERVKCNLWVRAGIVFLIAAATLLGYHHLIKGRGKDDENSAKAKVAAEFVKGAETVKMSVGSDQQLMRDYYLKESRPFPGVWGAYDQDFVSRYGTDRLQWGKTYDFRDLDGDGIVGPRPRQ